MNSISDDYQLEEELPTSLLARTLKAVALVAAATVGAAAIANAVIAWNAPGVSRRLGGGFCRVAMRYGDAAYSVSGSGSPVLLLHALRPGNSSDEWAANYDALAREHTVYALDFLGWGLSDKPRHILRPSDYAEQIRHFAEDVIGEPCTVIASGEAANFALLASQEAPELFSKMVLICPATTDEAKSSEAVSGDQTGDQAGDEASDEETNLVYQVLSLPILGETILNWLSSRHNLENEAQRKLFYNTEKASPAVVARLHAGSHQSGTRHALASHASGLLAANWSEAWSTLAIPALLVWGRNAPEPGIETAPEWLALNPDAHLEVFDEAMLWPHVEHAEEFNARLLKWLA